MENQNQPQVSTDQQSSQSAQQSVFPQAVPKKSKLFLILIIVLFIVLIPSGAYILGSKNIINQQKQTVVAPTITQKILTPTPSIDPTANWKTYQNKEAGFEFKYPPYLEKLIQNPNPATMNFWVQIEKKDGLNNPYKGQECPASCGRFAKDSNLYQKQFTLLTRASNTKDCIFDKNYMEDFKNFILFYGGIPGKWSDIQGIKLDNQVCGIKYGALDGYDISPQSFNYRFVYMMNDKAVGINFPIFPFHVFSQVDSFYTNLGFDLSGDNWNCRDNCKEGQFFNDQVFQNMAKADTVKSVVQTYNQILSTFRFIN